MEGTFAKIYKGTVLGNDGSEEKAVIKTVNGNSIFANILSDIYEQPYTFLQSSMPICLGHSFLLLLF